MGRDALTSSGKAAGAGGRRRGRGLPVLGVAGAYCSGKSALSAALEKRGWVQIEVDDLGHEALVKHQKEIVALFSPDILSPQTGAIDRRQLGRLVFADPVKLSRLEALVHPFMVQRVRAMIEAHQHDSPPPPGIIINAAILYKMKLDTLCDLVLWIQAPRILRFLRARRRDRLSARAILRRLSAITTTFSQLPCSDVDRYRVTNIFMPGTLRRVEHILQVELWEKIRPTSLS